MNSSFQEAAMKFLYGFLFAALLPLLLVLWAAATEHSVPLNIIQSDTLGTALAATGLLMVFVGMTSLVVHGKGLPMNAFPPAEYVNRGIYRLIPHPIYTGFCICCFGTALLCHSQSGFWLVSPLATLGCVSLVQGYEKQDLSARFGNRVQKSYISLPLNEERRPLLSERLSVYILVLVPWVLAYEAFVLLGPPDDAVTSILPFEAKLPTLQWTELFYGGTYLFVALLPIIARSAKTLREFSIAGLAATTAMVFFFIFFPLTAPPREFAPDGLFGRLLLLERNNDTCAAAFPSYHVIWAMIAARAYSCSFPRFRFLWRTLAVFIAASCLTTGMHSLADVLAGGAAGFVFLKYREEWEWIRSRAEQLANSWKDWRFGNLRIINHGVYAGVGTGLGVLLAGTLLGPDSLGYILLIVVIGLVTSGLWAQVIEGSPSLLRPYGYYGGVLGAIIGITLAGLLGGNVWALFGAFAVAGPIIQAFGRLRCLVQGCCHGREAPASVGIRYTHKMSRVCRLSDLSGVPLHPTPVYSILWNIGVEMILLRLWFLHAEPSMITGLYLILNGLGRFVEEAYRGEPQTPIVGKLRLYQIMSILSVATGAVFTTIHSAPVTSGLAIRTPAVIAAAVIAAVVWFALGVDFPNSSRRFARLA